VSSEDGSGKRAKQTQFSTWCPEMGAGRPGQGRCRRRAGSRETKPIPAQGGRTTHVAGTNRAKRTQFAVFRLTRWTRCPPPDAGHARAGGTVGIRWQRPIEGHQRLTGRKMNRGDWTPGGSGKRRLADGFANAMDHRQAPKRVPNRDVSRLGAQTPLAAATRIGAGGTRRLCRPRRLRELRKNPMRPGAASVSIQGEPLSERLGNLWLKDVGSFIRIRRISASAA